MLEIILAIHLITLHGPSGQVIEINPNEISSVRTPLPGKFHHKEVRCVITMTNGNFNAVIETCDEVNRLLGNAEGQEK